MARVFVVTDRRLIGDLTGRIAAILDAVPRGSVAIQVREKDLDGGPLLQLVRDVIEVARPRGAQVWVNDRADVARIAGADGVHLPERGLSIDDARALGLAVGCSRHSVESVRAAAAAGAALVQLGPIWATPNKGAPIGVEALSVRRELPATTQLVAVGGIDGPARARLAAIAGADAVAVIRAAWLSDDPGRVIASLVEAVATRV